MLGGWWSEKDSLKLLKIKDNFFNQIVDSNKTYKGVKRYVLS